MIEQEKKESTNGIFIDEEINADLRRLIFDKERVKIENSLKETFPNLSIPRDNAGTPTGAVQNKAICYLIDQQAEKETDLILKKAQLDIINRVADGSFIKALKEIPPNI